MDVPKWWISENHIRDDDICGMHQLQEIWSCEREGSLPPHIPPHITLAINCSIISCTQFMQDTMHLSIISEANHHIQIQSCDHLKQKCNADAQKSVFFSFPFFLLFPLSVHNLSVHTVHNSNTPTFVNRKQYKL